MRDLNQWKKQHDILSGLVLKEFFNLLNQFMKETGNDRNILIVKDYSYANVSMKVERIILSYVDYVNKTVWKKNTNLHQSLLSRTI